MSDCRGPAEKRGKHSSLVFTKELLGSWSEIRWIGSHLSYKFLLESRYENYQDQYIPYLLEPTWERWIHFINQGLSTDSYSLLKGKTLFGKKYPLPCPFRLGTGHEGFDHLQPKRGRMGENLCVRDWFNIYDSWNSQVSDPFRSKIFQQKQLQPTINWVSKPIFQQSSSKIEGI